MEYGDPVPVRKSERDAVRDDQDTRVSAARGAIA